MPFERPLALRERLQMEAALDAAYAPLRRRRANISAARVRAALRWHRAEEPAMPRWRWASRLAEVTLAAGVTAFIFTGTIEPIGQTVRIQEDMLQAPQVFDDAPPGPGFIGPRVTLRLEGAQLIRWLRLDRASPIADDLDPTLLPVRASADPDASTSPLYFLTRPQILR